MKRKLFVSVSTLVILSGTLFGCSLNPSASNHNTTSVSANQLVVTQGDSISVDGANHKSSLNSVDFLDATTGWMLRNNYNTFTSTQSSQILKTQDGGGSWQTTVLNNTMFEQLKFVDQTTGWAIGQDVSQNNSNGQPLIIKILHSQDGGQNWDVQWEDKGNLTSGDKLWFQDSTHGYALIGGAMLTTQDGGKQWSKIPFDINSFTPQHMSFANADAGWVTGVINQQDPTRPSEQNPTYKLVVLHTVDGGKHWRQQFVSEYAKGEGPIGSVDIDFVNATTGWFLTSNLATMTGDLYYTSNAGQQWEKINQVKSARPTPTEIKFITPKIGWIPLDVGAGPIAGGLSLTKDGGKNFTRVGSENEMGSVREVDFVSAQLGWAVGSALNQGDYLTRTTDGGQTWTQVYPRLSPTQDMSFVDNQHGFGLGELADSGALLYTADGGDTWQQIYNFGEQYRPSMLSFVNRNLGWILAASIKSNVTLILRTTDGGNSWTSIEGVNQTTQLSLNNPSVFRFFDSENGLIVTSNAIENTFWRTQDGGQTWQISPSDRSQQKSKGSYQFSFASLNQRWEIVSAGSGHNSCELSQTKDGSTWQELGQISANAWSYGLDFISKDEGYILLQEPPFKADSRFKLLVTIDGGQTWSSHLFPNGFQLETQSDQMPIQFTDDQHGWILSDQGLLRTQDGGKTWNWQQGSKQDT